MNVQSLSIAVPAGCPNQCKFCVSKTRTSKYPNFMWDFKGGRMRPGGVQMIWDRMAFARDNGCNTMLFTGEGEPMMNKPFMECIMKMNKRLPSPFKWVEMQTSGYDINPANIGWMERIGVNTVSLSVSDIFDDRNNVEIMGCPQQLSLTDICSHIIITGLNLRISMNMTSAYGNKTVKQIFERLAELNADMVTFRKLWAPEDATDPVSEWVKANRLPDVAMSYLSAMIAEQGNRLERLPFGAIRYSFNGISTVIDDDCMSQGINDVLKYLILRTDGKLYTRWDDKGSLLF